MDTPIATARSLEIVSFGAMTDSEVISCFEQDKLAGEFHHQEHVRLAFAYLSQHPPLDALRKFSEALKRYAAARGKRQLYHETIAFFYLLLIRERMARTSASNWEEFEKQNPDLLRWKPGILDHYYHESTLHSDVARSVFLFPDKLADL